MHRPQVQTSEAAKRPHLARYEPSAARSAGSDPWPAILSSFNTASMCTCELIRNEMKIFSWTAARAHTHTHKTKQKQKKNHSSLLLREQQRGWMRPIIGHVPADTKETTHPRNKHRYLEITCCYGSKCHLCSDSGRPALANLHRANGNASLSIVSRVPTFVPATGQWSASVSSVGLITSLTLLRPSR